MIHLSPWQAAPWSSIHVGDCLEWLRSLPDDSVDAIVTDPPYGLGKEPDAATVLRAWLDGEEYKPGGKGFMGRAWDAFVPSPCVWQECRRMLKPGGHLMAFAGTRTYDWIVMGVRLAGFEVRDMLGWLTGQGFPKSLDIHKATGLDQWSGWGTALKPACEPIVMARKPLQGTVAANVLRWGTGGINVDGGRVPHDEECRMMPPSQSNINSPSDLYRQAGRRSATLELKPSGRWPANIVHDGSEEVEAVFPVTTSGTIEPHHNLPGSGGRIYGVRSATPNRPPSNGGDTGSASRFYYAAKASREEREHGLSHLPKSLVDASRELDSAGRENPRAGAGRSGEGRANIHPTVKPVDLMRWLTRLVTPPGGTVVDPYTGSGTTGVACALEGFKFLGCELETPHALIAHERIRTALEEVERAKVETPTGQLLLLPGLNPP